MSETMTSVGDRLLMPILPTLEGNTLDLKTLRGMRVLVFMWGSW